MPNENKHETNLQHSSLPGAFFFLTYTISNNAPAAATRGKQFSAVVYDRDVKDGFDLKNLATQYGKVEALPYMELFTPSDGSLGAFKWQDDTRDVYFTGIYGKNRDSFFSEKWPFADTNSVWKDGLVITYINQNKYKMPFKHRGEDVVKEGLKGLMIGSANPIGSKTPAEFMLLYHFSASDVNLRPKGKLWEREFESIKLEWIGTSAKGLTFNGQPLTDGVKRT